MMRCLPCPTDKHILNSSDFPPAERHAPERAIAPLLSVRNLQRPGHGPFDFNVAAGECLAITGESGSGKSVLLRMLADLDPSTGNVALGGTGRETWSAPVWRKTVTYQAAEPAWWAETMREHLASAHADAAEHMLPLLKLRPALLDTSLSLLSTGERQRLALIRSLVQKPRVFLLDEPASALDASATECLELLLKRYLTQATAMIIVTHSSEQVARMADRVFTMQDSILVDP
jgi:ABC-type iron transport system FetAB ATPase subunit